MTGIRDARGDGFKSKTHGDSGTGLAASTGSTAIDGDGPSPRRRRPMRTIGIRDAMATGFKIETNGGFATSMATSIGSTAVAGDGTTGVVTARKAAPTI